MCLLEYVRLQNRRRRLRSGVYDGDVAVGVLFR
jgi:hypothetical protein